MALAEKGRLPGTKRECSVDFPTPAEGRWGGRAVGWTRAPRGWRRDATPVAPALPPGAHSTASSHAVGAARGRGLAAAEDGDGGAGRAPPSGGEREAGGGRSAAAWPGSQACSAERPPEPWQEVSEWRSFSGALVAALSPGCLHSLRPS